MAIIIYAALFIMPILQIIAVMLSIFNPAAFWGFVSFLIVSHLFQMKGAQWMIQMGSDFSLYRIKNKRLNWYWGLAVILLFSFLLDSLGIKEEVFNGRLYTLLVLLLLVMLSANWKVPQFIYLNSTALGFFLKLGQIEYIEIKTIERQSDQLRVVSPFQEIDVLFKKADFFNADSFELFCEELEEKKRLHLAAIKN